MAVVQSTLNWHEVFHAVVVGGTRNIEAKKRGRPDAHGYRGDGWSIDIEGAAAEMAYAKMRDAYWLAVADNFHALDGDVGRTQIRSTARPDGCLILHPDDPDDSAFVLAIGCAPTFRFVGWGYGRDLKRREYWREDTGRPAFFIPQAALQGADE